MASAADILQEVEAAITARQAIITELDLLDKEKEQIDLKRIALRKRREELSAAINSKGVQQRVATHEEAAAVARAQAERSQAEARKLTDELADKNRQADELLAKLTAASVATTDAAVDAPAK